MFEKATNQQKMTINDVNPKYFCITFVRRYRKHRVAEGRRVMYYLYNVYDHNYRMHRYNSLSELPSYDSIVFVPCFGNPAGGRTCAKLNMCK